MWMWACEDARVASARTSLPGAVLRARAIAVAYSHPLGAIWIIIAAIRAAALSDDEKGMIRPALDAEGDGVERGKGKADADVIAVPAAHLRQNGWDSLADIAIRSAEIAQVEHRGFSVGIMPHGSNRGGYDVWLPLRSTRRRARRAPR